MLETKGFSLLELLISSGIVSTLMLIALPTITPFIIKTRVDNEIYQLHQLLLVARNTAINTGKKVTLCPLDEANQCTTQWHEKLALFIDDNNNKVFEKHINERLIATKPTIKSSDSLVYGLTRKAIVYSPTGRLSGLSNGTFRYCPQGYLTMARGITVAISGKVYQSKKYKGNQVDKNRNKKVITCD